MVEVGAAGPSGRAMVEEQCKRPLRCCRAGKQAYEVDGC